MQFLSCLIKLARRSPSAKPERSQARRLQSSSTREGYSTGASSRTRRSPAASRLAQSRSQPRKLALDSAPGAPPAAPAAEAGALSVTGGTSRPCSAAQAQMRRCSSGAALRRTWFGSGRPVAGHVRPPAQEVPHSADMFAQVSSWWGSRRPVAGHARLPAQKLLHCG